MIKNKKCLIEERNRKKSSETAERYRSKKKDLDIRLRRMSLLETMRKYEILERHQYKIETLGEDLRH